MKSALLERLLKIGRHFRNPETALFRVSLSDAEEVTVLVADGEEGQACIREALPGSVTPREFKTPSTGRWLHRARQEGAGLCFRRTHRRLYRASPTSFFIPCWVYGQVDLRPGLAALLKNSSLRSDVRRIRKHGLTSRVVRDPADLVEFYETMYVPYVGRVHGQGTEWMTLETLQQRADLIELVQVLHQDRPVGGVLLLDEQPVPRLWSIGVLDGDDTWLRQGVIGALYLAAMERLVERKAPCVHLGGSRAFVNDGVLQYKRKWQYTLTGSSDWGWELRLLKDSPGLRQLLARLPFLALGDGELEAVLYADPPVSVDQDPVKRLVAACQIGGVNRLRSLQWKEPATAGYPPVPPALHLTVQPALSTLTSNR